MKSPTVLHTAGSANSTHSRALSVFQGWFTWRRSLTLWSHNIPANSSDTHFPNPPTHIIFQNSYLFVTLSEQTDNEVTFFRVLMRRQVWMHLELRVICVAQAHKNVRNFPPANIKIWNCILESTIVPPRRYLCFTVWIVVIVTKPGV